jgi:CheY-like chemotaxis protein
MTDVEKQIRILIAEDDEILGTLLRDFLENPGREITIRKNGQEAIRDFKRAIHEPDEKKGDDRGTRKEG